MIASAPGLLAHVYPMSQISIIQNFLLTKLQLINSTLKPIDISLNEFLEENPSLVQYHLVPDLVQHVGVYSSASTKNQGNFKYLKESGTFDEKNAANHFQFDPRTM
ncbi:unnamed protein product [Didymodactylos carnosus]|uniref:Uncharacterized protein n=1 Tax=Didymodactylos carnosus TaxID=1234261 RepID=A0A815V1D9_9BILA|nr:unnamed protein product [Didymodactylos carnosus]CAF4389249.1 unnamed protein product [Didymodactylos carnosus]